MLIDTHILVWLLEGVPGNMGPKTLAMVQANNDELLPSSINVLEIRLKQRKGGLLFIDAAKFVVNASKYGRQILPVTPEHSAALPLSEQVGHADSFDLLLVAQAMVENLPLLTCDEAILGLTLPGLRLIDGRL